MWRDGVQINAAVSVLTQCVCRSRQAALPHLCEHGRERLRHRKPRPVEHHKMRQIEESRPLSKLKRWALVKITKKATNVAELPVQ